MKHKATENNPHSCRHNLNGGRKAAQKKVGIGDKVFIKSGRTKFVGSQFPSDQPQEEVYIEVDLTDVIWVLGIIILVLSAVFDR